MPRIGFQLKVAPQHIDEYVRRHAEVWPEMLAEIAAAGRRNYSLFLAPDGTLFGSYDVDDEAAPTRTSRLRPSWPVGKPTCPSSSTASKAEQTRPRRPSSRSSTWKSSSARR